MKPFYLSEITTKDGLMHQGIFYSPIKPGKKALLWVHGLTSRFYGDVKLMNDFAEECGTAGFGFAAFNHRGHDFVAGVSIVDPKNPKDTSYGTIGAAMEEFEKCIYDIHAGVDFLVSQGFFEIVVLGHSSGANKICYSEAIKPHKNIIGVILAGPISDRIGSDTYHIARMEKMIAEGKGDELVTGVGFFPMTPKRYLSLYKKGSAEDVFDYDDTKNGLQIYSKITKPLLIIISEKDEYIDRPPEDLVKIFDAKTKSKKYKSIIIPGTTHEFDGKEEAVAKTVVEWVKTI